MHDHCDVASAFAAGREACCFTPEAMAADIIRLPRLLTPFYAMICGSVATRLRSVLFVQNCVRHYAYAEQLAKHIATSIGEFHAAVVRRNEFVQFYPQTNIDIATIEQHIAEAAPFGSLLVIATDEANREFFAPLTVRYKVVFMRDLVLQAAPADMTRFQLSCIEQNLCALAESFVGTRFSTFSAYVNRLRGYHGCGDTRVRFTDGTHRRIKDTEGCPRFSWEPARRHGEPLWGREFREGWSLQVARG